MPNIGYGSAKVTKHVCPDGFKKVLVHNVKVSNVNSYRLQMQYCFCDCVLYCLSFMVLDAQQMLCDCNMVKNISTANRVAAGSRVSKCHSDLFGMSQHLPFRSGITVKCLNCPPLAFSKYGAGSDDLIQS